MHIDLHVNMSERSCPWLWPRLDAAAHLWVFIVSIAVILGSRVSDTPPEILCHEYRKGNQDLSKRHATQNTNLYLAVYKGMFSV